MDGEREVKTQTSAVQADAVPSEKALASMEHAGHGGSMGHEGQASASMEHATHSAGGAMSHEAQTSASTEQHMGHGGGMAMHEGHALVAAHGDHGVDVQGGHSMEGIPTWMAMISLSFIIVLSHVLLRQKRKKQQRTEEEKVAQRPGLLHFAPIRALVQKSYFPLLLQAVSVSLFLLILATGLFGNQRGSIATVLTWTWWWALLVFIILAMGKAFCSICPWEALASLATSLSLKSRIKKIGFELRWPTWARNIYPALALFVLLTWIELGHEVTHSPAITATLGAAMAGMAILAALFFEKRSFCRYACLVGRVSGIYALFSPVELREKSQEVCRSCVSVACVKGSETATGCPTNLFPGHLRENTYCTLCTECIRACPHNNLDIRARPFAADLLGPKKHRWDEAFMAMVLLALTSFHGVTMTPQWGVVNDWIRAQTGMGRLTVFTALMAVLVAVPIILFWGSAAISRFFIGSGAPKLGKIVKGLAYAVIPVALFYHLAHNSMHFFMEGQKIIPLLSDPFGWGWDLFGTAGQTYSPLLALGTIWWVQVVFIVVGHAYGVVIADRIGRTLFAARGTVLRGLIPFIALMVLFSSFSLWLIAQPMEMRSGM